MAIIRFDTRGTPENRLQRWEDMPANEIESGNPVQRGRVLVEDKMAGLSAGEWDCTAFTSPLLAYPVHEFMHVLEGGLDIIDEHGHATHIGTNESFAIAKGFRCRWKQTGYMRKFFVIFDDKPDGTLSVSSNLKLVKPDPAAMLEPATGPAADILLTPPPEQRALDCLEDATNQWSVGLWDSTPYERKSIAFPRHELMHILKGAVTLTEEEGATHHFRAGDTFFVEMGTRCNWKSTEYVRKIYCTLKPAAAAFKSEAAE